MFCVHFPFLWHCPMREQEIKLQQKHVGWAALRVLKDASTEKLNTVTGEQNLQEILSFCKFWEKVIPLHNPKHCRVGPRVESPQLSVEGKKKTKQNTMNMCKKRKKEQTMLGKSVRSHETHKCLHCPVCLKGCPVPSSLLGSVHMTSAGSSPVPVRSPRAAATAPRFVQPFWGEKKLHVAHISKLLIFYLLWLNPRYS